MDSTKQMRSFLLAVLATLYAAASQSLLVPCGESFTSTALTLLTRHALGNDAPFTLFIPSDGGWREAGIDVGALSVDAIAAALQSHVHVGSALAAADVTSQTRQVESAAGTPLSIRQTAQGHVKVNEATVLCSGPVLGGAVVHVIDSVLESAPDEAARDMNDELVASYSSVAGPESTATSIPTIVQAALATPDLSTLVRILTLPQFSAVLDALSSEGPFTVFAPTNQAFADAGVDLSETDTLSKVLQYHVLNGRVLSTDLSVAQGANSLQGERMFVVARNGVVTINGESRVVAADVQASNGVVHVVDTVLVPPSMMDIRSAVGDAIDEGAPLFNAGDESGCYYRYLGTAMPIKWSLAASSEAHKTVHQYIKAGKKDAAALDFNEASWDLRRALDAALGTTVVSDSAMGGDGDAKQVIQEAIATYAQVYNDGDHKGCYEGYLVAAERAVDMLSGAFMQEMEQAIAQAKLSAAKGDYTSGAWDLRAGFDFVLENYNSPVERPSGPFGKKSPPVVQLSALSWDVTDDRVMGGVSRSSTQLTSDSGRPAMLFSGYTTTDSNGGFSNARAALPGAPLDFSMCSGVSVEVKGDGLKYVMFLMSSPGRWGVTYEMDVTPTEEWQRFDLPFDGLVATSMGLVPGAPPIDASSLYSIGIKRTAFDKRLAKDPTFKPQNFAVWLRDMRCMDSGL